MKTLVALAAGYLTSKGTDIGFLMKSGKTGKIFKVVSKTPSGSKFVIVSQADGEEFVVDGTVPRYSLVTGNDTRIAALTAKIENLEAQRDLLDEQIVDAETELEGLDDVG